MRMPAPSSFTLHIFSLAKPFLIPFSSSVLLKLRALGPGAAPPPKLQEMWAFKPPTPVGVASLPPPPPPGFVGVFVHSEQGAVTRNPAAL